MFKLVSIIYKENIYLLTFFQKKQTNNKNKKLKSNFWNKNGFAKC